MRWPFVLRSTHERAMKEQLSACQRLNTDAWEAYCRQRDETRGAQKGLLRLQRKMKKLRSSQETGDPDRTLNVDTRDGESKLGVIQDPYHNYCNDYCRGCMVELCDIDNDPNGDRNSTCAQCRAEERHDFDVEPGVLFDRRGNRKLP